MVNFSSMFCGSACLDTGLKTNIDDAQLYTLLLTLIHCPALRVKKIQLSIFFCTTLVDLPVADVSRVRELQLEAPILAKIAKALEAPDDLVNAANWPEHRYVMVNGILLRHSPDSEDEEAQQVLPKSQNIMAKCIRYNRKSENENGAD
uniref:Uncharacterized protein n=1 Tax=Photinus pyralis TaxID=7054 RepID=A0A1Y1LM09_PHOPY